MKGSHALIVAIVLGIGGALLNSLYLHKKSAGGKTVDFVGIADNVTVNPGEPLLKKDLVPVPIPADHVGNLQDLAYRYDDELGSVIGQSVSRPLKHGSLVLRDHLRTPRTELSFSDRKPPPMHGKRAMFVPVDARVFISSLVEPGDWVDFLVARSLVPTPTPAASGNPEESDNPNAANRPEPAGPTQIIGPFEVLSVGTRLGRTEVLQSASIRRTQENVITVSVEVSKDGTLEGQAQKLADMLAAANSQFVGILLHDRKGNQE